MIGMMMSATTELTIAPKAAPMMTPIARSTTLPRMANFLNSVSIASSSADPEPDQHQRHRNHGQHRRQQHRRAALLDRDVERLGEHEGIGRGRQRRHQD